MFDAFYSVVVTKYCYLYANFNDLWSEYLRANELNFDVLITFTIVGSQKN